jgi:translation initiation factor IF-3
VNEFIRLNEARIIGEAGEQLGIMSSFEALEMAKQQGLDLVEISPMAKPPVLKIMDFGKFQYQKSRQERLNKAKQKTFDIKGIRIGVRTDDHDLEFKKDQAEKFLKKGDKVKIEIILRGREKAHQDLGRRNLEDFIKSIEAPNKIEQAIKRFPGGFNVIIAPIN